MKKLKDYLILTIFLIAIFFFGVFIYDKIPKYEYREHVEVRDIYSYFDFDSILEEDNEINIVHEHCEDIDIIIRDYFDNCSFVNKDYKIENCHASGTVKKTICYKKEKIKTN